MEGCAHGELGTIYATIAEAERFSQDKVDLLICCGDFQVRLISTHRFERTDPPPTTWPTSHTWPSQAVRNEADLETMSCPRKYRAMQDFYKYYNGECVAPVLTIFIGGNHESSAHNWELPYGGW